MPKITVSGIQGRASGLGISLALSTDHILVSENSQFVMDSIEQGIILSGAPISFWKED